MSEILFSHRVVASLIRGGPGRVVQLVQSVPLPQPLVLTSHRAGRNEHHLAEAGRFADALRSVRGAGGVTDAERQGIDLALSHLQAPWRRLAGDEPQLLAQVQRGEVASAWMRRPDGALEPVVPTQLFPFPRGDVATAGLAVQPTTPHAASPQFATMSQQVGAPMAPSPGAVAHGGADVVGGGGVAGSTAMADAGAGLAGAPAVAHADAAAGLTAGRRLKTFGALGAAGLVTLAVTRRGGDDDAGSTGRAAAAGPTGPPSADEPGGGRAGLAATLARARAEADNAVLDKEGGKLTERVAQYQSSAGVETPSLQREWSADFARWAVGTKKPLGATGDGKNPVLDVMEWADDHGAAIDKDGHKPQPGQVVVLDVDAEVDGPDSLGIVEKVDGAYALVIQGDVTSHLPDDTFAGAVRRLEYGLSNESIVGYIDPTVATDKPIKPAVIRMLPDRLEPLPSQPPPPPPPPKPKPKPKPAPAPTGIAALKGAKPPAAPNSAPRIQQILDFIDWSAAQYAKDDAQYDMLRVLLKNLAAQESSYQIAAVNNSDANARAGNASTGLFQYVPDTFTSFNKSARKANPDIWGPLGDSNRGDWRQQALTTAWALSLPPTDHSRAFKGYPGDGPAGSERRKQRNWAGHQGAMWHHWSGIIDIKYVKGVDPTKVDWWKDTARARGWDG